MIRAHHMIVRAEGHRMIVRIEGHRMIVRTGFPVLESKGGCFGCLQRFTAEPYAGSKES